jgi:short-chain fatty acids transporter
MRAISGFFVRVFEYAIPDPYVFAVLLTLLTGLLAAIFAPHHTPVAITSAWYKGIFDIFEFALQMILILVTGYALASSVPVRRGLFALAARPTTTRGAVTLTFLVSAIACWLNWGFGLVVAGLLSRAIAQRMRIDFGWLVAAAYCGFLIWASGLSSSIALAQATPGSKLNIVQSLTGNVLPLSQTIFTSFNLVPVVVLLIAVPFLFITFEPRGNDVIAAKLPPEVPDEAVNAERRTTFGSILDNAWILNLAIVIAGAFYLISNWTRNGFSLPIQSVIFIFFLLGLLLHWTPVAYVRAINDAARVTGPLLIQYPLYGGIMGIMTGTGLAGVIAQWFVAFSTAATLPFWSYLSSIIISLFVPSGGGHWAVQGPFVVPAAAKLGASQAATAMGVAIGEEVANMIQPFWCLPVLAIAGIGLRRVMAFTAMVFFIAFAIFGASLLVLSPHS